MQYYFASKHDEMCYDISHFEELMEREGLSEMTLFKAKRQEGVEGFFWCKHFSEVGDKSEGTCGRGCKAYEPRNGVSGCCKHYSLRFWEASDEKVILKLKT